MLTLVLFSTALLGLFYLSLNLWIAERWPHDISKNYSIDGIEHPTKFSIVIPVRNGAGQIGALLDTILDQNYPSQAFEIIVINDHSTDKTLEEAQNYKEVRIEQLSGHPHTANKKMAIEKGVQSSKNPYIITTDADCEWSEDILSTLHHKILEENPNVICGPVEIISEPTSNYREKLEQVDMAGMMLVTNAGIRSQQYFLGNGAFLCYRKIDFEDVNPFEGNHHIASGDDVFLVDQMAKRDKKVIYLVHEGIVVRTHANRNWKSFVLQRKRWSGKNKSIGHYKLSLVMAITFLFNLALWISTLIFAFQGLWWGILFLWAFKFLSDTIIYMRARKFFSMDVSFLDIPILSVMHSLYIVVFGSYGIVKKKPSQRWK